jgi:hypothetical protein
MLNFWVHQNRGLQKSVKSIAKQKRCATLEHHGNNVKVSGDGSHDVYMELPFFIEG